MSDWNKTYKTSYPLPKELVSDSKAWGSFVLHGKLFFGRIQETVRTGDLSFDNSERLVLSSKEELRETIELLQTLEDSWDERVGT